jgi:hypothetical protein
LTARTPAAQLSQSAKHKLSKLKKMGRRCNVERSSVDCCWCVRNDSLELHIISQVTNLRPHSNNQVPLHAHSKYSPPCQPRAHLVSMCRWCNIACGLFFPSSSSPPRRRAQWCSSVCVLSRCRCRTRSDPTTECTHVSITCCLSLSAPAACNNSCAWACFLSGQDPPPR